MDKHIGIIMGDLGNKTEHIIDDLNRIIIYQKEMSIPIVSIMIMDNDIGDVIGFLSEVKGIRIRFIGEWFGLSYEEDIKKIMDRTKENIDYYMNVFINYNPFEDILNAVKKSDDINYNTIRENTYYGDVVPCTRIIKIGKPMLYNFMMWENNPTIEFRKKW